MANEFVVRNGFISQNNSIITGSLNVTGSVQITGSLFVSNSINSNERFLFDNTGQKSVLWSGRTLNDVNNEVSIDWGSRGAYDSSPALSIDWGSRKSYYANGNTSLNWESSILYDSLGNTALDWADITTAQFYGTSSYAVTSSYVQSAQSASFATTASFVQLAQSASSVLVDREALSGPSYIVYVDQADPNGAYVKLYNNNAIYLTGSTLIIPRVESSFTGSLLGTASFATQALSASWAPGGGNIDTSSFVTQGQVTALVSCRYLFSGF